MTTAIARSVCHQNSSAPQPTVNLRSAATVQELSADFWALHPSISSDRAQLWPHTAPPPYRRPGAINLPGNFALASPDNASLTNVSRGSPLQIRRFDGRGATSHQGCRRRRPEWVPQSPRPVRLPSVGLHSDEPAAAADNRVWDAAAGTWVSALWPSSLASCQRSPRLGAATRLLWPARVDVAGYPPQAPKIVTDAISSGGGGSQWLVDGLWT